MHENGSGNVSSLQIMLSVLKNGLGANIKACLGKVNHSSTSVCFICLLGEFLVNLEKDMSRFQSKHFTMISRDSNIMQTEFNQV